MKIALINLPSPFLINDKTFPPLGILYMAAALRKHGYEVKFYDFTGGRKMEQVEENILFITFTSPQLNILKEYVNKHTRIRGQKIIVGGCGTMSLTSTKDCKNFNVIVRGEGENIIDSIFIDYDFSRIVCGFNVNVNTVAFPARDLLSGYDYKINNTSTTTMITSRGCPFSCIFCTDGSSKSLRITNSKRVCEEIDEIEKLGYKSIMFFDDIFTLQKDRLKEIVYYLKSKDMTYRCFTHVNFVDMELCKILADTGCWEIGIGIESGSNKILKTIRKGFTREKSLEAILQLKQHDIRVKTFLMLGLPEESGDTIQETKNWLREAKPDDFDISLFQPFPGTRLWDEIDSYDIDFKKDSINPYKGKYGEYFSTVSTSYLTSEELIKQRDSIEKEFKNALF